MTSARKWVIDRENFRGYPQTVIINNDGNEHLAYSDLSVEEYLNANPSYEVVDDEEFMQMMEKFHDSLVTKWSRVKKSVYYEMLEVLPPGRWSFFENCEVFYVIERITADLVQWYMRRGTRYYTCVNYATAKLEDFV